MGEILNVLHVNPQHWTKVILQHPTACTVALDDTYSVIWDSGASLCITNDKADYNPQDNLEYMQDSSTQLAELPTHQTLLSYQLTLA